jgi:flagellin-like protein
MFDNKDLNRSVSPVIGVVLMVALVVALAALVTVSVFVLQDNSGDDAASASVDITETTNGIKATVVRNENVKEFIVESPSGTEKVIDEIGETTTIEDGTGLYNVIAVLPGSSKQVIDSIRLTADDIGGLFTVNQDEDQKEAYATVEEDYDSTSNYEITVVTEEEQNDSTTVFYEATDGDERLLKNPVEREGYLLQQGIQVGKRLDLSKKGILNIASVSSSPSASQFGIGETVQLHKMTNLCKGDEIHLVDEDTEKVIAQGEEIKFDMPDCDQMRRVAQYQGGEIVAVELINLWNQDLDYAVFESNADVPPPTRPTPEGDDISVTVNVEEKGSGKEISDASVILGDRTKNTDSQGKVIFNIGNADKTIFATASKSGYYSSQLPVDLSSISSGDSITKTIVLPNRTEQSFSVPNTGSGDSPIGSVSGGDSVTVETSGSSEVVVSGGSGGSTSTSDSSSSDSSGSTSVSSGGDIYSGSTLSSTTTLSSATEPDSNVMDETNTNSNDPMVNIVQPDRQFNTIPIDQDLIPTGTEGEFKIRTSIRALEDTDGEIEDTIKVKAIRQSDGKQVNLEGVDGDSQNKTVYLTPGKTEIVEQTLYFPNGTLSGDKNEEFSILVTLDSTTNVKSAGSLELFNGSALNAEILGGTVTPNNPKISEEGSQEITVSVDYANIDATNPVTVDLFENGQRIDTKEVNNPSNTGTLEFTTQVSELGYYEYHIGIQESQSVALADSILVSPKAAADININSQLQVKGAGTSCDPFSDLGSQFDCEIEVGESVNLDGEFEIKGQDVENYSNVKIIWTWKELPDGQEVAYNQPNESPVIDWSQDLGATYDPTDYDETIVGFEQDTISLNKTNIQYNESDVYLVEVRIRGEDSNGNQIGGQADATINVAQDPSKTTSRFVESGAFNEDTSRLVLESTRATSSEDVRIDYVHNNTVQNSRNVTVPRQGGQVEILEELVLSNYQDDSATVGEDITVNMELYDQSEDRDSNDPVDTENVTFEVIPEIVIDANIRPIACQESSDTDTILKTLGNVSDWSNFDSYDSRQDAEDTFATSLDEIKIIDPTYWTGSGLDKSAIENDTSCVVAG